MTFCDYPLLELYADGTKICDIINVQFVNIAYVSCSASVIAALCKNGGGSGGFAAIGYNSLINPLVSDDTWLVYNTSLSTPLLIDWYQPNYNDSGWLPAVKYYAQNAQVSLYTSYLKVNEFNVTYWLITQNPPDPTYGNTAGFFYYRKVIGMYLYTNIIIYSYVQKFIFV